MELKVLAEESGRSPSVSEANPDEKEISDDEDDDRNHKHRRRDDARSQSQEPDAVEQVFTKPYRKANKSFENGYIYRGSGSQSSETFRNSGFNPMDSKFDKRRLGFTQSSQGPLDLNQRIRGNAGSIRGRGRDNGHWSQSIDMALQGHLPPSPFAGRGLASVSNAYGASWGAYGLVPGMGNGGLDTIHPLALQGAYRSINPCMNVGMGHARQRCRDFEEQGFCLRGDMCPMEHGVNRIVVEDVQSLSQFNLPVSLQNANMPSASGGSGCFPASGAPMNSKAPHGKSSKHGMNGNEQNLNDAGADSYDPDQPIWGNNNSQTSPALQLLTQSNVKENGPLMDPGPSCDRHAGLLDDFDKHSVKTGGAALGRVSMTKNRMKTRENLVSKASPSTILQKDTSERRDPSISAQVAPGPTKISSQKIQNGNGKSVRKPSQKAQCTLFVNNVPLQQNKRETLISHFHKFGEVIDIYIPVNTERAFIQFSKREEAEAALMAPDAVMGNRFIKLWWANRDNVPVKETSSGGNTVPTPIPPRVMPVSSASQKDTITPPVSDQPKPLIINTPKVPTPSQKKLDNLEVLKEQLRKKQELLDQKRDDFRRKLDKLAKQATSLKGEIEPEQVSKRRKIEMVADSTKAAPSSSVDPETISSSTEIIDNGKKSLDADVSQSSKSTAVAALPKPPVSKSSLRPLVLNAPSSVTNPFKLDNRPTAFKISTLPNDLANVAVLKDHFSPFGELSEVELHDLEPADSNNDPGTAKYSACVYFATRHAAEKAFLSGKCLNGHNLQFSWLKSSHRDSPVSSSYRNSDTSIGSVFETPKIDSHKPATYGDGESEILEQKDFNKKQKEPDESNHAS
ncbi:zinc finger CCCH domain-containing protein 41-like [Rutidosis leptorrhynchoides]|uniref:zinc finger CCCH domain-containing protein 41-like n=1 Tax=Rutidosis leptorrhynchoides TaxID=125765 RepID=UPI003A98F78B